MKKTNIFITSLGHFLVHFSTMILPSIIILLRDEFDVSIFQLGTLIMVQTMFMGISGLPSGIFVDRFGIKSILSIYFFGIFLSSLILYFSNDYLLMYFGMALLGLITGLYHPAGLKLISSSKDISKQMAIHGIFGSLGLAVGPIYGSYFGSVVDWRLAYLVVGLVSLLGFLLTILFIEEKDESGHWPNLIININKNHILIFSIASLWGLAHHGLFNFLPYYFSQRVNLGIDIIIQGGLLTAFILLIGIIGQYIGGNLGAKYKRTDLQIWVVGLNIPFLILMGFLFELQLIFIVCILGAINFMFQPINNSLIADITDKNSRGLIYGFSFGLSFGIGSLSGYIGGVIAEMFDINYIFPILAIFLVPATILAYILKSNYKNTNLAN